jgi:hypothetical protein
LKCRFSRLFGLVDNKMALVVEMNSLGCGVDGEAWRWWWRLLAWEEEQLTECCEFLDNIVLWLLFLTGGFDNFMLRKNTMFQVLIIT